MSAVARLVAFQLGYEQIGDLLSAFEFAAWHKLTRHINNHLQP
jgi:hypothetical protein